MTDTMARSRQIKVPLTLAVGALLAIALALRLWPLPDTWLWSDEIFSVSLAEAGFWKALIGTFRHDLHPPVYYLQLVPWAAVFTSDAGLVLNSVLWDMARIAVTLVVLFRVGGPTALVVGGIAAAFVGSSLYTAENLRMYAMMGFAIVAAAALTERMFARDEPLSWRDGLLLFVLQGLVAGSHGAGPLFAVVVPLHGLVLWVRTRRSWRQVRPWLAAQVGVGVGSLLVIINGLPRETDHYRIDWTWHEILFPLAFMSGGDVGPLSGLAATGIAAAVTVAIIALGLASPGARRLTAIYVVTPILLALVLSATVKPIYGFRTLMCAAVFLPLVLGLAASDLPRRGRRVGQVVAGVAIMGIVAFGLYQRTHYTKDNDYPALAAYLRANLQPGDVILQRHQPATAWAVGRYLIGPGWGDVMQVQHPDRPKWRALFERLGPGVAEIFRAETDRMMYGDIPVGLGDPAAEALVPGANRVWVVATFRYDDGATPSILQGREPDACQNFRWAFVCRYDPA